MSTDAIVVQRVHESFGEVVCIIGPSGSGKSNSAGRPWAQQRTRSFLHRVLEPTKVTAT